MKTFQEENWAGQHGNDYIERNPTNTQQANEGYLKYYGLSRTSLNQEFLGDLGKNLKVLEVGCNVGAQLAFLQEMGFNNLYGIEINQKALVIVKKNLPQVDVIFGSALDIPFKDSFFDLVFTSGVLIHISPKDIKTAQKEIVRVSKKYIWGFEYFNEQHIEVPYRGKNNLLWKGDFAKLYLKEIPNLKLVKEKRLKYLSNENIDTMFLLEKQS
ncbi:methyltransferase domain-containing protein [Candidatus Parcubacteria bacterium]|nr:methyltransferase domain-containing protein [Candidatus Parcubacteria bacterium]